MKNSLQNKLYDLIKSNRSITYGEMCEFVNNEGYKISTAERKLRILHEGGKIDNQYRNSKKGKPYICGYKLPTDYIEPVKTNYVIINGEKVFI